MGGKRGGGGNSLCFATQTLVHKRSPRHLATSFSYRILALLNQQRDNDCPIMFYQKYNSYTLCSASFLILFPHYGNVNNLSYF